jgi:hypothetical protein
MIGQPEQLQLRAANLGLLDTSGLRRVLAAAQSGWNRLPAGKIRRATALPARIQHAPPGANEGFIRVHPQRSGNTETQTMNAVPSGKIFRLSKASNTR